MAEVWWKLTCISEDPYSRLGVFTPHYANAKFTVSCYVFKIQIQLSHHRWRCCDSWHDKWCSPLDGMYHHCRHLVTSRNLNSNNAKIQISCTKSCRTNSATSKCTSDLEPALAIFCETMNFSKKAYFYVFFCFSRLQMHQCQCTFKKFLSSLQLLSME